MVELIGERIFVDVSFYCQTKCFDILLEHFDCFHRPVFLSPAHYLKAEVILELRIYA